MKVLWITNTLFPDVCQELGIEEPVIGGWMYSGARALLKEDKTIQLAVAALYNGKTTKNLFLNGIQYFLLPKKKQNAKYDVRLEIYWKSIQLEFHPDVVHIHGTEYPHGLAYINACGNKNVVASIQGLVSVSASFYYGGISIITLFRNITIRDIVRLDTIFMQHSNMRYRGLQEQRTIKSVDHIIGRTSWDKTHIWALNPDTNYHFCNETLRNEFYQHKWELDNCEKHSIFLSQANYPIKGLQQMLAGLPLIARHFPNVKVYVAGNNFVTNRGWRLNGYGKYINSLIKKSGISQRVIFTGNLSEKNMCQQYLRSHVFVCPSSIENSSNSIGEAQLLGVPCVASYVGGSSDLIEQNKTGILYRFEEIETLAHEICEIFSHDNFALELSKTERETALLRHDRQLNAKQQSLIYKKILDLQ